MRTVRYGVPVALALVVGLAACGDGAEEIGVAAASDPAVDDVLEVSCGGSEFDFNGLSEAPSVASLPEGPAGAVDDAGAPAFDASLDWKVVHQSDDRVELIRELEEPVDGGTGDVRTHESRTIDRITGASNVADGTWLLTSAGPCTPRRAASSSLGQADLTLADTPSPDATSIDLLVHERACASGVPADGRVEIVAVDETAEQVRLHVGVRQRGGDQDCQGNPPTPFSVELSGPLGDRAIVDASVVPPRPLSVDGT